MAGIFLGITVVIAVFAAAFYLAPKGWRTIWFNGLTVSAGAIMQVIEQLQALPWELAFDGKTQLAIIAALSMANMVLRKVTNTPMGEGDDYA